MRRHAEAHRFRPAAVSSGGGGGSRGGGDGGASGQEAKASSGQCAARSGRRPPRLAPNAPLFKNGDTVEADFGGGGDYYSGKVKRARSDGTFDIWYEDGDRETEVPAKRIRRRG